MDYLSSLHLLSLCFLQVAKSPKPVASCAMPAAPGMKIKTDSALVKKAREGVMEFLLVSASSLCRLCTTRICCTGHFLILEYGIADQSPAGLPYL